MVLFYFSHYTTKKSSYESAIEAKMLAKVDERLSMQADYRKELEIVNSNQIKLANELDLVKKTQSIKTSFGSGRPSGSIV